MNHRRQMNHKVLMIVHQKTSVFGRIGSELEQRGYHLERCCPPEGDPLPPHLDNFVGTVIFGGPQSANDDHLEGIRKELDWIPIALDSKKPFLGICLGAQMLAKVLGGKVALHPDGRVEIGYIAIQSTPQGRSLFPESIHVYQWHKEGAEVPQSAVLLAEGTHFRNQAFSYEENAYGIQFHPELTMEQMERWMTKGAERLKLLGAQQPEEQRVGFQKYDKYVLAWMDNFFDHWLSAKKQAA